MTDVTGALRIVRERERQIVSEGWDAEHDAQHKTGQLALAAALYAIPPYRRHPNVGGLINGSVDMVRALWPGSWSPRWWKPDIDNRVRELEKAGALIAAEIDRLLAEEAAIEKVMREHKDLL